MTAPGSPPAITPLPVPPEADAAILFGGSFDPVTLAHVRMSAEARRRAEPDAWLVFVPAARNPLKTGAPIAPDADRVDMLRLAIQDLDRAVIWTDELDRARADQAPSYTIDTLARARATRPDLRLRLLIGADQALGFHRWRDARRILDLAPPIVMPRNGIATRTGLTDAIGAEWTDREREQWGGWFVSMQEMDVSATRVRQLLELRDLAALANVVDDRVIGLIRERGLYKTG